MPQLKVPVYKKKSTVTKENSFKNIFIWITWLLFLLLGNIPLPWTSFPWYEWISFKWSSCLIFSSLLFLPVDILFTQLLFFLQSLNTFIENWQHSFNRNRNNWLMFENTVDFGKIKSIQLGCHELNHNLLLLSSFFIKPKM